MDQIKNFARYVFSIEFLLKLLIIFAIIALARGEFIIRHIGYIDIGTAFELKVKTEQE